MNENVSLDLLQKTYKLDLKEDQKLELGWRIFFKLLEGSPKQISEGLSFLESNSGVFKRAGESQIKINFWKAEAYSSLKKDKDALKILSKNFSGRESRSGA